MRTPSDMTAVLIYESQGRTARTAVVVGTIWVALFVAWMMFDASVWILLILGLFTLPALLDLFSNRKAGLRLDGDTLMWFAGRGTATIALAEIDHVRLDTRLDLSVRATIVPREGRPVRLPYESTPPHQKLEDALHSVGIRTERHHFNLMQ